jgi:hypothetical protein
VTIPTFPVLPLVAYPVTRSLITSTVKEEAMSGQTFRYPIRSRPKWQWQLSFDGLRENFQGATGEWTTLNAFLLSILGAASPFYYLDQLDNAASAVQFGTGDGVTTAFQLVRNLSTFVEPVYGATGGGISAGALSGAPSIYINSVLQSSGYTIGPTGLVTFTGSAPASAAAITWTGNFAWLCEIDDDTFEQQLTVNGLYAAKKLSFTNKLL